MADYGYGTVAVVGEDGFNSVDWVAGNKGITPMFRMEAIPNERKSEAEGRAVYDNVEVVLLYIAGDQFSVHSAPVDGAIKARFPEQYAHWKRTQEGLHVTGTPLKMWPMASPAFIMEMASVNIHSVDDLANVADVYLDKITDGRVWRERAQTWLNAAKETATENRLAGENERLRERLATLERNFSSLADAKPLRPKKTLKERSEIMKRVWAERKSRGINTLARSDEVSQGGG